MKPMLYGHIDYNTVWSPESLCACVVLQDQLRTIHQSLLVAIATASSLPIIVCRIYLYRNVGVACWSCD